MRSRVSRPSARALAAVCYALALSAALPAVAQERPANHISLDLYLDLEDVQEPRLSPDGRRIIYTRRWVDKLNDRWESSLWIMDADGGRNRFLVNGSGARWSPDGSRVGYLAPGEPAGTQVWVRYMDTEGATTQITRLTETPSDPEWSPDGKWLAFRMLVLAKDDWKIAMPAAPKGAKWTEAPRIVQRFNYRLDRQGYVDDGHRHLFVVSADGGTARRLTSGDWDHGAPRWTPDGKSIVFSALRVEDAELQFGESEIYAVDIAAGDIRQLTIRKGPDENPVVSPDGRLIAYTGHDETDDTWRDATLYVMRADGSNSRTITASLDRTPQRLMWAADGGGLYFGADDAGTRNLHFVSLNGDVRAVTKGTHMLTVTDVGRAGQAVGVVSSPHRPNDVVTFAVRSPALKQLTAVNDDILAGKRLGEVEEIWYRSADDFRVQGWVIKPPGFDSAKKYPMMLVIHGGPHAMYNVAFNFGWQEHAANGYVVLYTNPRGSTGYGSAFGNAIKHAYPSKDYDDLMAGVDTLLGRGYVDPRKLFVYGCSGGGVLTAWIVGHTDRFAAASANCPVVNWLSFAGTTDINLWGYKRFPTPPWEDPALHLKHSPLMYAGNVRTPTMLMTGVQDLRTPISQTEEFYQALKLRKIPTAMIRFNDEWHGTSSKPSNFIRTQLYLRDWFQKHSRKP
ncbi:MAG: S9 family peptidase, partial [Gemmatimonadota bacterium]|nr:S9 family peptidase [Gemmatimonadota bacterium]